MFKIAAIGELLWDNFPDGKRLGGAPANFAVMSKYLGHTAYIISAVGDDEPGVELIRQLDKWGIHVDLIQKHPAYRTGEVNIQLDRDGNPSYQIVENRACDHILYSEKIKESLNQFDAITFGSLSSRSEDSKQTIFRVLNELPEKCLKVCDLNIRKNYYSEDLIEQLLNRSDIFKINQYEKNILENILKINLNDSPSVKGLLKQYNLEMLIITNGDKGSEIITLDDVSKRESLAVKIIDTVGAGDSFLAACVDGYLKKYSLDKIHDNAVTLSAIVCQAKGATGILC